MTDDARAAANRHNRVYAAHVLIRATVAQDIYTMERVMARWGSGDQAGAFISALAGAAAALAFFLADQDEVHTLEASDRLAACAQRRGGCGGARAVAAPRANASSSSGGNAATGGTSTRSSVTRTAPPRRRLWHHCHC